MKRVLLVLCILIALGSGLFGQTAADPNEGSRLVAGAANTYSFKWYGRVGRTYFIKTSPDLFNWTYLNEIVSGQNLVASYGFATNGDKLFVRLAFSDTPTNDPFGADFDGDGDGNALELLSGTNPNQAGSPGDQDGDGNSDAGETAAGTDPSRKDNPSVQLAVFGFTAP